MGKVGSNSITKSIRNYYNGLVLSTHHCPRELDSLKKNFILGFMNCFKKPHVDSHFPQKIVLCLLAQRREKIKIISLFREPIEQNISWFFMVMFNGKGSIFIENKSTLSLIQRFLKYRHLLERLLAWFDEEIKQCFNIDVFARPFPKEQGYDFYKNEWGVELLLMRYNLNDRTKEKLIEEFIGIKDFKLINKNISANKPYGNAYEAFKKELKLPLWYIDKVKNSKYFNHFYSKEFIEQNCNHWIEKH